MGPDEAVRILKDWAAGVCSDPDCADCQGDHRPTHANAIDTVLADRDEWRETARNEMDGRRAAESEVARLERLILDWDEAWMTNPTAGPGRVANSDGALLAEARRIRAQREEHQHRWFTFDETHVRCDGCGATQREEGR